MPANTTTMSPHRKLRKRRRRRTLGTIQSLLTSTIMILIIIIIGQQSQPIGCSAGQQLRTNLSISTTTTTTTPSTATTIIINNDNGKIPSTRQERDEGEKATKLDRADELQETKGIDKQTSEEEETKNRRAQLSKRAAAAVVPQSSQQQQQLQFLQQLRVSESDLLPFSDFYVQQPAFSDIMKSWPPTTRRQTGGWAATATNGGAAYAAARTGGYGGGGGGGGAARAGQRSRAQAQRGAPLAPGSALTTGGLTDDQVPPARNHLNEDYDDSIVTADESFEQDQLPEPPTWVNYLGELGDFIYSQLVTFFDSSSRSPFSASGTNQTQNNAPSGRSTSGGATTPIEIIDELLDDFYYDQYENSQVLYYGPQLVRQGDTFELGCYLPHDQPAEWTKSGKSLVGGGGGEGGGNRSLHQEDGDNHVLATSASSAWSPLRLIKSGSFLVTKRNYSLKVFEAQPSDSGNYRCNRLSRKYHKLLVVPARLPSTQLYLVQQRLLAVVGSSLSSTSGSDSQDPTRARAHETSLSQQQIQLATLYQHQQLGTTSANRAKLAQQQQQRAAVRTRQQLTIQASGTSGATGTGNEGAYAQTSGRPRYTSATWANGTNKGLVSSSTSARLLIQGHLIREQQPLSVACHITDELVLRKLRELPQFQLAWYKNGRLLRGSQSSSANNASWAQSPRPRGAGLPHATISATAQAKTQSAAAQRIQFFGPNGRQMFISSPSFSDAGDYLCSWAKMAALVRQSSLSGHDQDGDSDTTSSSSSPGDRESPSSAASGEEGAQVHTDFSPAAPLDQQPQLPVNPLSAASHHQLVAPVKLRPFKSAYHARQHDQLRLFCQVQRGFPAARISWYVGNQLVDADFLREHPGEFRILELQQATGASGGGSRGLSVLASPSSSDGADDASVLNQQPTNGQQTPAWPPPQIVEINPVPGGRQQMALTSNGRGQWVNHADLTNERYAIDTPEHQLRYLQMKLGQLTGASELLAAASDTTAVQLPQQAGLSMLVVNKLDKERHTSRYACRATTRANTDEVTTVIRVKGE